MPRENDPTGLLAEDLKSRLARARDELIARMAALGLTNSEGWRVREEVCSGMTGTLIVLRPMHFTKEPPDIEIAVQIGHDGHAL